MMMSFGISMAMAPAGARPGRLGFLQFSRACAKAQRQGRCPGLNCAACKGHSCRVYRHYAGLLSR